VVGLITNGDETAYKEVRELAVWRKDNNLSLNVSKTKKLTVECKKSAGERPHHTDGAAVERVKNFQIPWCPRH
jgi:hypothetical protein